MQASIKFILVGLALSFSNELLGQSNAFQPDSLTFPLIGKYLANILTTGQFHNNEVKKGIEKENWFGLFKKSGKYYLKQTSVQVSQVQDQVADDKGIKTGWDVSTSVADSSILLVSGLTYLNAHSIESPKERIQVRIGETITLNYLGNIYTINITANKKEGVTSSNFKMFIATNKQGVTIKQLLVALPDYSFDSMTILFAGDMDGDGVLDLIIDTAWKENIEIPTLYLSKPADKTQLLKVVGMHITVGC